MIFSLTGSCVRNVNYPQFISGDKPNGSLLRAKSGLANTVLNQLAVDKEI